MFASMFDRFGNQIVDMYDMSAFDANLEPAKNALLNPNACVYVGHYSFGMHEWLARSCCYMAIMRKPLDRIISLYYYNIQFRENLRRDAQIAGQSIPDFFKSHNVADMYEDYMPWIEGEQTLSNFLDCNSHELDNGMVRRLSGIGISEEKCPEDALKIAKENIENYFSVVGVQERYPETVRLVQETFGWTWLNEYHVNKGMEKKSKQQKGYRLTNSMARRIKNMNKLDINLYQWVLNRFDKQVSSHDQPKVIQGKGRTDFENVPLWRSIGESPIRRALEQVVR